MRGDLEPLRRELAAESEHGRAVEVCVSDTGHEIGRAGPERDETDARDTGRRRRGLSHERGRGLVLREDEVEPRLPESLDEVHDLTARMSVDIADAGGAQPIADCAGDR